MIHLILETLIAAPVDRCFDLARSIDLHMASTDWTGKRAIAGITSGLIGPGQEVTWEGRYFGLTLHHASRITQYDRPCHFQDCMLRGRFRRFCHDHYFDSSDGGTVMRDEMEFAAPYGMIGWMVERAVLKSHMADLLESRNNTIKVTAEGEEWRRYLSQAAYFHS
jgi:ligand-binding SRPBCC domain-containing protein